MALFLLENLLQRVLIFSERVVSLDQFTPCHHAPTLPTPSNTFELTHSLKLGPLSWAQPSLRPLKTLSPLVSTHTFLPRLENGIQEKQS